MSEIHNTTITVSGVEDTGTKIKLKDENKKTYSFWKVKKDGSETVAFQNWKLFKVGDTVELGYKEESFTGKEGNEVTTKNVMNIKAAASRPVQQSITPKPDKPETKQDEAFWDKKAYKQCLWGYWLQAVGANITSDTWKDVVWNAFKEIEQDAEKRFSTGWAKAEATFKPTSITSGQPVDEEPPIEVYLEDLP